MKRIFHIALMAIVLTACKQDPSSIFEVEDVTVSLNGGKKNRLKTDIEFVSIAYTDIFSTNISQNNLEDIITTYKSLGDKSLVIEMIVRKFISEGSSMIQNIDRSSSTSIETFVTHIYKKLYNRTPDAYELWYLTDLIQKDQDINASLIYYSMMTANEYRYY